MTTHPLVRDLTGRQFTRLTVLRQVRSKPGAEAHWLCECQCGNSKVVTGSNLRQGFVTSCGCRHQEIARDLHATHGRADTPENKSWRNMRTRARKHGLWVDPRWSIFENFLEDLGERPARHRLRTTDPASGYGPQTCYWAPPAKP